MSQDNLDLIRRANAAFNAQAWDEWLELVTPDIVYREQPGNTLDTGEVLRGKEQVRESVSSFTAEFAEFRSEIDELIDADDRVVCVQRWLGTGRESGFPVEFMEAIVFTVRDGKIAEGTVYPDRAAAIEAVGLSGRAAQ